MDRNKYRKLVEETASELTSIMDVSLGQRAKDLVKGAMGRSVRVKDPMFWPAGMLMLGLSEARAVSGNKELYMKIDTAMESHVKFWKEHYEGRIDFVDDALAGAALVKMYAQTGNQIYKEAADRILDYLMSAPRNAEGAIIYNPGRNSSNIFVDGIGQTVMFLSLYGRVFNNAEALSLAKTQLTNYKKYGMDQRTGLCYHGYSITEDGAIEKKGLLGWGRAVGWLMLGLSEYSKDNADTEISDWYRDFCGIVESYVRKDGGFSWQLQAVEGHLDTSATGMLLYGIRTGDITVLENSTDANGRVGNALSSCDDFGVHHQTYGYYHWGQGAALAAISQAVALMQ